MKLYVGNLPYNTTDDDLRTLFSQYGAVTSVAIITDRDTGRSKGFGFVEYGNDDEARTAITALSGHPAAVTWPAPLDFLQSEHWQWAAKAAGPSAS